MPRWRNGSRRIAWRLVPLTMACVVVIFVASTAYTELLLTDDADALDISLNSAPSIAELANARGELRPLATAASRVVATRGSGAGGEALTAYEAHRRAVAEALAEYGKTPDYPGERELYGLARQALARLDAAVRGDANGPAIDGAIDEADAALRALSDLNRDYLARSAATLQGKTRRRNLYAFLLDGLGILGAFIATVLATRNVERTLRTLGRRERELEHLAIEVGHEIASPLTPIELALGTDEGSAGEPNHGAMSRARRGVGRIRASLERLTTFAAAGKPLDWPHPKTALAPVLEAVARELGGTATCDPSWQVTCTNPSLHTLLRDLFSSCTRSTTRPEAALGAIEVTATPRSVRLTVVRGHDGDGSNDPFDPQLHVPGGEHPGLDLRLATVRRRVEACGGRVGRRRERQRELLWIELPRA